MTNSENYLCGNSFLHAMQLVIQSIVYTFSWQLKTKICKLKVNFFRGRFRRGRLCPLHYYWHPRIFKPSYDPVIIRVACLSENEYELEYCLTLLPRRF